MELKQKSIIEGYLQNSQICGNKMMHCYVTIGPKINQKGNQKKHKSITIIFQKITQENFFTAWKDTKDSQDTKHNKNNGKEINEDFIKFRTSADTIQIMKGKPDWEKIFI